MKKTERSKPSAGRTSRASYRRHPMSLVQRIAVTASAVITFAILVALLAYILIMGVPNLKPGLFAWHYTSDNCSMTPAIINTLLMVVLSLLLSVPFGIGAAIYLVEYAKRGNKLVKVVRLTAETLSGIPSIVYGLFGYLMFVIALNMDKSMLAGALTLAIMVLPTILRTTEEALKAVPDSFREGSFGLGAGKLRTVFRIVLPSAVPGIFSGIILAIGRIVGETAALIFTAGTFSGVAAGHGHRHQRAVRRRGKANCPAHAVSATGRSSHMEQDKIVIEHLNLWYGSFQALKDINLRLPANEITAFIGPSGCGKSTLLKSLNRMNDLVEGCRIEGTVTLDGEDIFSRKMDVNLLRKRVGMVFQKPNPFPMSIYDNVAYGPRTHGIRSRVKLDEIVEKSLRGAAIWDEVKDRLKKSALGMSGGQQQRLCIARALAVEPEVLLMDEPTSALDPISTSRIEELAMELKKDYTIVMVTHNMQQAARISDKTAFFLLGDMVEFGPTEKIFSMPQDRRTEDYITGRFG